MGKKLGVKGLKFGHLTALERVGRHPTQRTAIWRWRCDCGNEREIEARRVVAGHTRTCGKCELKHKLVSDGVSAKSALGKRITREYQRYVGVAERRKIKFALNTSEFAELMRKECSLCGAPPSPSQFHIPEPASRESGYTHGNVYLKCKECNTAFNKTGISLLISRIIACYKHLSTLE